MRGASQIAPSIKKKRIPVLDGWRGLSIFLVLLGHMLALGPKWMQLNAAVSAAGLSIFFFLSGFLVASMLLDNDNIASFFIRRIFRILPMAWLAIFMLLLIQQPQSDVWLSNLFFYANLPGESLLHRGEHLWSLSVEIQFYLAIGASVAIFGKRALYFLPVACITVTLARIICGAETSIITWFRVDEILVGGTTAVLMHVFPRAGKGRKWPISVSLILLGLLFASSHSALPYLNYLRPYITAALVYSTFEQSEGIFQRVLSAKLLRYLAEISYALYVVHPLMYSGWLGEGGTALKYAKRILLSFPLTFILAHCSSRYYEKYFNRFGHAWAARIEASGSARLEPRVAGEK